MLDILQLRINPDDLEQLRLCQIKARGDCLAAFTVRGAGMIWPVASWDETPVEERMNVRGWFALLDQIADEFLIWRPQGGCFFVLREGVIYRNNENDTDGVLFLQFEVNRLMAVPPRQVETTQAVTAS
jgi:hypothetical protein